MKGIARGMVVRSAMKISIFSMRPTCVANITDIKRQASGGWRGFAAEVAGRGPEKKAGVFAAERLTCNELP